MSPKKKKSTRLQVDKSEITGAVLPCPLCSQRFWDLDALDVWKRLYRHLRHHHNERRAAELTQKVRKKIWRLNWEIRQNNSNQAGG